MWGDPRLLNAIANALFAMALALVVYAAGTALAHSRVFSLRAIRVQSELSHVNRGQIVEALQGRVSGTFFTVDLEAIRSMFEGIPWVRRAEVRRHWPDGLEVKLEEQVALARWGQEGQLVNVHGELFVGQTELNLPLLAGPTGSEREVARRYAVFRDLLAPLALDPRTVALSQRRSWQLKLSNGLTVQLGRDNEKDPTQARLARFVDVYPRTIGQLGRRLDYADLRYPNGFALRVPEFTPPETQPSMRNKV
jgi:cell division protein FtsQ